MCYDLFGEIPVTEEDCFLWVAAVAPRWLTPERSYRNYLKNWDIPAKVRAAKLDGTFWDTVNRRQMPYHARLSLASIV